MSQMIRSDVCGCEVWAKAEQLNPSGTGKDRIALAMLRHAEACGSLPAGGGGVVVEGSSGSTSIALAPLCAQLGHRLVAVLPDDCSDEKRDALAAFPGVQVETVRAASIASPSHYVNTARRRVRERGVRATFFLKTNDETRSSLSRCVIS